MTIRVVFLAVAVCHAALGDSFMPSTPEVFSSPSGKYLVRIEAADSVKDAGGYWKQTEFNIFYYDEKTEAYDRLNKFDVEGHPLELFINDLGTRIVTIDQHFGVGYGQIAALYSIDGKRLAEWRLKDLFDVKTPFDPRGPLRGFRRSTSSIYWRGDAGWNYDQKSIWVAAPMRGERRDDGSFIKIQPSDMDSYVIDLEKIQMRRVPPESAKAEQGRGAQPAAGPESKPE